jgi:glycosyltransferase involved in cell wall biosynthesis
LNPTIVRVLTRLGAGGPPIHAVVLTRELSKFGYSSILVTGSRHQQDGDMSYLLREDDPVYSIPEMSRSVSPWQDLRALIALYRFLRRQRPQIVHTHTAKAGVLGRIAARLAGVPVVVHTFHGNVLNGYFSPPVNFCIRLVERALAYFTDGICVLAPQQAFNIVDQHHIAPQSKVHVIPLGVDMTRFHETGSLINLARATLNGGRITIGWMGRFVPIKDIPLLVAVVRETLRRTDRVRFVVAGDGPEAATVKALAAELGPERFEWLGWREDVDPILAACDVLMQTSRNEGTPMALIQGMAAGRPFVSTAAGGVVDMVTGDLWRERNGCRWFANGILAEADPAAFASAFCELTEDPSRIATMGRCGAEFANTTYSLPTMLRSLDALYSALLEKKIGQVPGTPGARPRHAVSAADA